MIQIPNITLMNGLLGILVLAFIWMMYRFNKSNKNKYNIVDILMGPGNRASLTNHILLWFAGLSSWVVIDRELKGKDDISTILLGVLGVFVLQKTANIVTDLMNKPEVGTATATETSVVTTETKATVRPKPKGGK
jgi:hypothetical protein